MGESKLTWREHLDAIWKQTGSAPDQLEGDPFPEVVAHVWGWYLELHNTRTDGPISYREIESWARITGTAPTAFEISLIKKADFEYLKSRNK